MNDQRTTLYAKSPSGRYKAVAHLDDPHVSAFNRDGLWLCQTHASGQSSSHICDLDDLPCSMLNVGRCYSQRDAVMKLLQENRNLSDYDLAGLVARHFATV